jgi:hypothetical protein
VVGSFFLSFFVVSCNGEDYHTTGTDAAFGNKEKQINPHPLLILVPGVALIVLILVSILSVREKNVQLDKKITATKCVTVIGSIIGLILLAIAHDTALKEVRSQLGMNDISSYFRTGIGFKISVGSYIAMFVLPFVDIILRKINIFPQNNVSTG